MAEQLPGVQNAIDKLQSREDTRKLVCIVENEDGKLEIISPEGRMETMVFLIERAKSKMINS